jgi:hypothetical protein
VIDGVARPHVGVVAPESAIAARVLALGMTDRVPRARVAVLERAVAEDRLRFDVLLVMGAARVAGRSGGDSCAVVRVPGDATDVARLAAHVGRDDLRRSRVETMRLLGWLGGDELPQHAGVDEVIAAVVVDQRYAGSNAVLAAIAMGSRDGADPAAMAVLDAAAESALECWKRRGSPGAVADARPGRRVGTLHAAMRVEMRRLEREVEAATARAEKAEAAADLVTGSRTWRYTEKLREAYHGARGRLRR